MPKRRQQASDVATKWYLMDYAWRCGYARLIFACQYGGWTTKFDDAEVWHSRQGAYAARARLGDRKWRIVSSADLRPPADL